jgi:hypothetical protein
MADHGFRVDAIYWDGALRRSSPAFRAGYAENAERKNRVVRHRMIQRGTGLRPASSSLSQP